MMNGTSFSFIIPTPNTYPYLKFHPTIYFLLYILFEWWKTIAVLGSFPFCPSTYAPCPIPYEFIYYLPLMISGWANPIIILPFTLLSILRFIINGSDSTYVKGAPERVASLYPFAGEFLLTDLLSDEIEEYGCFKLCENVYKFYTSDGFTL